MKLTYGFMENKILIVPLIDFYDDKFYWHDTKIKIERSIFNDINYNVWRLMYESVDEITEVTIKVIQTYLERFDVPKELSNKLTKLYQKEDITFYYQVFK